MGGKVKYEAPIKSMFAGREIKIQGRTTNCSKRFSIDLQCRNPCDQSSVTIPLHISVRFDEGCIVRNTLNQCDWGKEERGGGMPIVRGESFTIELVCKSLVFSIIINGCHFCDYKHRLPYNTINNMKVAHDVEICEVSFSGTPSDGGCDKPTIKPNVYEVPVTSMFVGRLITVEGSTEDCTQSFDVDLVHNSPSSEIRYTIPLHIRFQFVEESIILNTLTDCGWGKTETHDGIPLTKGESFSVGIECKKDAFKISINGVYFTDYKHRLPYNTITHLRVKGDARCPSVKLKVESRWRQFRSDVTALVYFISKLK